MSYLVIQFTEDDVETKFSSVINGLHDTYAEALDAIEDLPTSKDLCTSYTYKIQAWSN